MESMIIAIHVLAAVAITGLVLIQHGKGADMGASFGTGASQTIFGSVGVGNALTKSTTWLAVLFFATSLTLAVMARTQADRTVEGSSLLQNLDTATQIQNQPATLPELPVDAAPAAEPAAEPQPDAVVEDAAETVEPQPETTEN